MKAGADRWKWDQGVMIVKKRRGTRDCQHSVTELIHRQIANSLL